MRLCYECRDGSDGLTFHDDPGNPRIVSISLGDARRFVIRDAKHTDNFKKEFLLTHGNVCHNRIQSTYVVDCRKSAYFTSNFT